MNLFLFRGALIKELVAAGWEVFAAVPQGEYAEGLRELGATRVDYGVVRGSLRPDYAWRAVRGLRKVLRETQPDVVHSFTHQPNVLARLAGGAVLVNSVTGLGSVFIGRRLKGKLLREFFGGLYGLTSGRCRAVVFQNPDDRELFARRGWLGRAESVLIRGSGVDVQRFRPGLLAEEERAAERAKLGLGPEHVVFTMAGRLVRDKGVFEFVEAVRRAGRELPHARFLLVGDADPGNPSSLGDKELAALKQSGNLIALGWRRDMDRVWAISDVAVLPSYREGLPVTMQEAAASGLPIITTDAPGCRELAGDGTVLVETRDAEGLYAAVARLAGSDELRASMGRASRAKAEAEFDARVLAREHLALYERLLGGTS